MGPGRSQFSWDAAALTPPSNFEAISSRLRAILGDFGQFWAVLNDFALVLSAFQHASSCEGCPRAGRVKVWVSQPSKYWNIYWYGWAQQVLGKYMESFGKALYIGTASVERRAGRLLTISDIGWHHVVLRQRPIDE